MACEGAGDELARALVNYAEKHGLLGERLMPVAVSARAGKPVSIKGNDDVEWFEETSRLMDELETVRRRYDQKWWGYYAAHQRHVG